MAEGEGLKPNNLEGLDEEGNFINQTGAASTRERPANRLRANIQESERARLAGMTPEEKADYDRRKEEFAEGMRRLSK